MPICRDRKIAFIHIPKTGGTSIEELLDLKGKENFYSHDSHAYCFDNVYYAPQHLTPTLLDKLVEEFSSYTTFCFTRHPYQKLISEYSWIQGKNNNREFHEESFQQWLVTNVSKKDTDHKLDQYLYTQGCEHIFKHQDLNNSIEQIEKICGIKITGKLKHSNRSSKNTEQIASRLSLESKEIIGKLYSHDFNLLEYDP